MTEQYQKWNIDEDCGEDYLKVIEPRPGPQGWYIDKIYKLTKLPPITENKGEESNVSYIREPDSPIKLVEPRLGPQGWYIANSYTSAELPPITENGGELSSVSSKREPDSNSSSVKDQKLERKNGFYTSIYVPKTNNSKQDNTPLHPSSGRSDNDNTVEETKPPSITKNKGEQSSVSYIREPDPPFTVVEPRLGPQGWYIANSYTSAELPSITENGGELSSVSSKREPDSKSASVKDIPVSLFSRLRIPHGGGVSLPYLLPPSLRAIPDVSQQHICPGALRSLSRSFSGDGQIQHNVADLIGWPPIDKTVNNVKDITVNNENTEHLLENNIETNNLRILEKLSIHNSLQPDEETYEIEKFKKNAMIIFNHENFSVGDRRLGTHLDVAALEDTFKQFRFDVTTHNDLTEEELFKKLELFSKMNFNDYGCICVAILTHGQDGGFLRASDTEYSERDVFSCFDALANRTLVAKPIIFLIQACRGSAAAAQVPYGRGQNVEFDASVNSCIPIEANRIIFHSSFFGRASIRVIEEGTWFIQTVCEQMKLHGSTDHLEDLFRRVRQIVAQDKEYRDCKQMPTVTTTLLKKLYL